MKIRIDKFVLAILGVICTAYMFPELGAKQSKIPMDAISTIGIFLIFFFLWIKIESE
tara:strand:- start:803 stop:973 length:171 start_codon:yes stop_codon:yes gene_type:complete